MSLFLRKFRDINLTDKKSEPFHYLPPSSLANRIPDRAVFRGIWISQSITLAFDKTSRDFCTSSGVSRSLAPDTVTTQFCPLSSTVIWANPTMDFLIPKSSCPLILLLPERASVVTDIWLVSIFSLSRASMWVRPNESSPSWFAWGNSNSYRKKIGEKKKKLLFLSLKSQPQDVQLSHIG